MLLSHEFFCSYYGFSLSLLCPTSGNFCVYFPAEWEAMTILLKVVEGFEPFPILSDFHQSSFQKSLFYQCLRFGAILGENLLSSKFLLLLSQDLALKICADLIIGRLTFEPVKCCHDLSSLSTWAVLIWMNHVYHWMFIHIFPDNLCVICTFQVKTNKNVQVLAISPGKENCPIVKTHCIMLYRNRGGGEAKHFLFWVT